MAAEAERLVHEVQEASNSAKEAASRLEPPKPEKARTAKR
jgi:hypothetical protein